MPITLTSPKCHCCCHPSIFQLVIYLLHFLTGYLSAYFLMLWGGVGDELNSVTDAGLACVLLLLQQLPMESSLLASAARWLVALSRSCNQARLRRLVQEQSLLRIMHLIAGTQSTVASAAATASVASGIPGSQESLSQHGTCRLSGVGLAAMFEAMGSLLVRSGHTAAFSQVPRCM